MTETEPREEESQTRQRWREWGRGDWHRYIRVLDDRYQDGEACGECQALATAPWHVPERRLEKP